MGSVLVYKDALWNLVAKEIKVRYLGAVLGFAWSFGNPVLFTLTYYFVFTYIFPSTLPHFALYIVVGFLHWTLFSLTISQSSETLTTNAGLIKKLNFPKIIIPYASFLVNLVFWLAGLAVFFLAYYWLGGHFSWALLAYPLVLVLYLMFIWGMGLLLAIAYVKFRDIKHITDVLIQILFWLTPIVYQVSQLPAQMRHIVQYNPIAVFVEAFHTILYQSALPSLSTMAVLLAYALVSSILGYLVFRTRADDLVEHL